MSDPTLNGKWPLQGAFLIGRRHGDHLIRPERIFLEGCSRPDSRHSSQQAATAHRICSKCRFQHSLSLDTKPSVTASVVEIGSMFPSVASAPPTISRRLSRYLLPIHAPAAHFALLAPDTRDDPPRSVLYLESAEMAAGELADSLQNALCLNPNYALCIRLGQLRSATVDAIAPGSCERYLERLRVSGQRLGDIKPAARSGLTGWHTVFAGTA
jgi:hypothetical protein